MKKIVKILFFLIIISYRIEASLPYEAIVYELIGKFADEMKQKYGLICVGNGGRWHETIERMSINFVIQKHATIDEARVMEVEVIERLVQMLNTNEKIRSYLFEYPFPGYRIDIHIRFEDENNDYYHDGSVSVMFAGKNQIVYSKAVPTTQDITDDLVDLLIEPYCEAVKIVKNRGKELAPHQIVYNELMHEYAKELKKDCHLILADEKLICEKTADKVEIKFFYFGDESLMDRARTLEVAAIEKFVKMANEKLKPFIKKPFTADQVKVDIVFQDSSYQYHEADNIASVTKAGSNLKFYVAKSEGGGLIHFVDEDYNFAKKMVEQSDLIDRKYHDKLEDQIEAIRNSFGPYNWHRVYMHRVSEKVDASVKELSLKSCRSMYGDRETYNDRIIIKIDAHYDCGEKLNLQEARKLTVVAVNKLMTILNEDKKIKPYLFTHPFPLEKLFFTITSDKSKGCKDCINYITVEMGKIYYYHAKFYPNIFEENYEDAKKELMKK